MASLAKLEDALQHVHELSKTALTKEIAVVVRASQGSSRASWKSAQRPNWWDEERHVSTDNIDHDVPAFGSVRTLTTDGIRAALALYYQSRIHFEKHVRGSADEAKFLEEDCNDGKNPFPPEHYEVAKDDEVKDEPEPEEEADVMEDVEVKPDSDAEVEEVEEQVAKDETKSKVNESDNDDDSCTENVDEDDEDAEYIVSTLDTYANGLRRGAPEKMLDKLREKFEEFMEHMESADKWTQTQEQYKLRIAFHLCSAKLLCDLSTFKREEDPELVTELKAFQKDLEPSDPSKSLKSRLQSRHNLDLAASDEDEEIEEDEVEMKEVEEPKSKRRPRKAAVESGFTTPVNDAHRVRRARAASRALKAGTPSRRPKANEVVYDANGNPVHVPNQLFSARGSPILIIEPVEEKSKRTRKARLPPPTPASSATTRNRRSKRNKR